MDGGSLGRHGLGSSSSWLDGVPFKIGPKFRTPPKVIYQPVIENSCSSTKDEYTFETEEGVLAWARAREEALIEASFKQEEAVKAALKNNEKNKPDQNVAQENVKSVNVNTDSQSITYNAGTNSSENVISHRQVVTKPLVPPRPPPPKIISEPGAILKPTPIQHLNKASNHNGSDMTSNSASNSALDVSMFECVDDPFDTLELQTLDDMEELKVVLDSSSSKNNETKSSAEENSDTNPQVSGQELISSEGIYELAAPVPKTGWETFDSLDSFPNIQAQKNLNHVVHEPTRNSESPASDIGEYVDIVEESGIHFTNVNGQAQNPFVKSTQSDQSNSYTDALSGLMPKLNSGTGIYKAVLPPITSDHMKVSNGEVSNGQEQNNSAPCHAVVSGPVSTTSFSFPNDTSASVNSKVNCPKPLRIPPPPPVKPNRPAPVPRPRSSGQMWSSAGPSLANSLDSNTPSVAGKGINPYSRHSMDLSVELSDPDFSQETNVKTIEVADSPSLPSAIQLNRYRPLPPAPSPRGNQPMGLTDPYNSLSHEAQVFTDRITSMGFLRAKVARAVEKFGQDEKEVFDHLFAVDVLVEKTFAPIHAEAALQSCKNDLEKAERLLELQVQLEQLGFSSERVRDALVTSDMDHDKALDLLTT